MIYLFSSFINFTKNCSNNFFLGLQVVLPMKNQLIITLCADFIPLVPVFWNFKLCSTANSKSPMPNRLLGFIPSSHHIPAMKTFLCLRFNYNSMYLIILSSWGAVIHSGWRMTQFSCILMIVILFLKNASVSIYCCMEHSLKSLCFANNHK